MEITVSDPSNYFNLFYVLAFVFLATTVIYIGRKKGYRIEQLLTLLGAMSLATIFGSRIVTVPINEWGNLLFTDQVYFLDRAASGGIIFGLISLYIAYRVLKFSPRFLIHFTWIVPIALSIQKMGCFLNGCCYGTPTDASWGVHYGSLSQPHYHHWFNNKIDIADPMSLGVHPVQLYEIVAMVLIAIFVWKSRRYWKKTWSALLFGLALIYSARFITEFFRDGFGSQFGTETWMGLRYIHWALLMMGILLFISVTFLEKGSGRTAKIKQLTFRGFKFGALDLVISLALITFAFRGVFSSYEWWALWITLIPALILTILRYLHIHSRDKYRWWALSAFLIPVWLIAQTVETVIYNDSLTVKTEKFNRIDVGANIGSFYNELRSNPVTTGGNCGGSSTTYTKTLLETEYGSWGAGYSKVKRSGAKETTWGVNGYLGSIESSLIDTVGTFSRNMWGINPYIKYDAKWYGVGAGLHAGRLYLNKEEEPKGDDDFDKFIEDKPILPEVYLRFGVRKYFDVDYNYGFLFPSPFPTTYQRVSIGTGLWQDNDYSLRFGKFFPVGDEFISAEALITKNFGVKFMYIFKDDYSFEVPNNSSGKFLMSLNYRFGHQ